MRDIRGRKISMIFQNPPAALNPILGTVDMPCLPTIPTV